MFHTDSSLLRHAGPTYFPLAFIARLPFAMMVVGVLTLVVAERGSVTLGGLNSAAAGIASTTPREPARHGANVCIAHPRAAAIVQEIAGRGVLAWNGRGRVRFSFHGYNDMTELDRIMDALRASL